MKKQYLYFFTIKWMKNWVVFISHRVLCNTATGCPTLCRTVQHFLSLVPLSQILRQCSTFCLAWRQTLNGFNERMLLWFSGRLTDHHCILSAKCPTWKNAGHHKVTSHANPENGFRVFVTNFASLMKNLDMPEIHQFIDALLQWPY